MNPQGTKAHDEHSCSREVMREFCALEGPVMSDTVPQRRVLAPLINGPLLHLPKRGSNRQENVRWEILTQQLTMRNHDVLLEIILGLGLGP